jgi:hypothetical protein
VIDNFEIKCGKCGNIAINIAGTIVDFGKVRVKFICLSCGCKVEVPVTQTNIFEFDKGDDAPSHFSGERDFLVHDYDPI